MTRGECSTDHRHRGGQSLPMWTPMNDTGVEQSRTKQPSRGKRSNGLQPVYENGVYALEVQVGRVRGPRVMAVQPCRPRERPEPWGLESQRIPVQILIRQVPGYITRCAWQQTLAPLARAVDIVGERSRVSGWREGKARRTPITVQNVT